MNGRTLTTAVLISLMSTAGVSQAAAPPDGPPDGPPPGVPMLPPPMMPRGLVTNEPGVTDGYVLFTPALSGEVYLVNNDGEVVHAWKTGHAIGGGMYLLPDGHLLRTNRDPDNYTFRAGGTGGILTKLDWDGNVVWKWKLSDEQRVVHHDVEPLPNGNLLALAWEVKSPEESRAAGRRPDLTPENGLFADWVMEIQPVPPDGANIVWEWHVWDHLGANDPGRIDINGDADTPEISPEELEQLKALGYVSADAAPRHIGSDFLHVNAVSWHPRLDQIAVSVPSFGEVWIIDHATTAEEARGDRGDLLYRWGNPRTYGRGGAEDQFFFYQHDVRWIPDGQAGAGNLTVFNNGRERPSGPWSSVDEWTPPVDAAGRYALVDGEAFGPSELAWQYKAKDPASYFAPFISGANRTPNGNTMTCLGTDGTFVEVTPDGRVVWEYRNPFGGMIPMSDGSPPQPGTDKAPFAVFRATRIPADHPGLAGRDLAPLDPRPEPLAWP